MTPTTATTATTDRPRAVVLGAGISGLAAAWALAPTHEVTVVEATNRPGGTLHSIEQDGFLVEAGPNTVQATESLRQLCDRAGCLDRLSSASSEAKRRYLVSGGELRLLPGSPPALLRSPILTTRGKLRLLAEPFIGRGEPGESVDQFLGRRLGSAAQTFGDAMVLGIYAGDPAELGVEQAFPRLLELEREHGSLFRGLNRQRKAGIGRPPIVSFRGGFAQLARALAKPLDIRYGLRAVGLKRRGANFSVEIVDRLSDTPDDSSNEERRQTLEARRLVVALPAQPSASLLGGLGETSVLRGIPHAPVAVVNLGFPRSSVDHPLDGFGFLVPHSEGRDILGCLFPSSLFPDRSPAGQVLLTVMVGGRRRADLLDQPDEALLRIVHGELAELLGVHGEPSLARVERWRPGIPQPGPTTSAARDAVDRIEAAHPGLTVLGNWLHGVGVPDCVAAAAVLAKG